MGDNIREEEQAKVDGLRAVNRMLREQNRVLLGALKALVSEVGSYTVERQYYSREHASKDLDRREKALLKQLQDAKAALTATSQPGGTHEL